MIPLGLKNPNMKHVMSFRCFTYMIQNSQHDPLNLVLKVAVEGKDYTIFVSSGQMSVWYGNSSNQDCKALQRVVRLAERISGSALPSLQDIYLKRCKSRAAKIIKDSTHSGNHLFCLLPSGKRFRSMMAKTERLRRSFFPQAIRLLNTKKAVCTSLSSLLFIVLFIKSHILFLHILLVCTSYCFALFFILLHI